MKRRSGETKKSTGLFKAKTKSRFTTPRQTATLPKRAKTKFPWKGVLWTVLIANSIAAYNYSPLTNLRTVKVFGAVASDESAIQTAVDFASNKPATKINRIEVQSLCQEVDSIKAAKFDSTIFGTAEIKIVHRTPILKFVQKPNAFVDSEGIIYSDPFQTLDDPQVPIVGLNLQPEKLVTAATIVYPVELTKYVDLGRRIAALNLSPLPTISTDELGILSLDYPTTRVIFGDFTNLDAKLDKLRETIVNKKPQFDASGEINLIKPATTIMRTEPSSSGNRVPQQ